MRDCVTFSMHSDEDICRVCMERGTILHPLICPCDCKGSVAYIHEECLRRWIMFDSISPKSVCTICNGIYDWEGMCPNSVAAHDNMSNERESLVEPHHMTMSACVVTYRWIWIVVWISFSCAVSAVCRDYAPDNVLNAVSTTCEHLVRGCNWTERAELMASLVFFVLYVLATLTYDIRVMKHGGVWLWIRYRWGVIGMFSSLVVPPTMVLSSVWSPLIRGAYTGIIYVMCAVTCEMLVQ